MDQTYEVFLVCCPRSEILFFITLNGSWSRLDVLFPLHWAEAPILIVELRVYLWSKSKLFFMLTHRHCNFAPKLSTDYSVKI